MKFTASQSAALKKLVSGEYSFRISKSGNGVAADTKINTHVLYSLHRMGMVHGDIYGGGVVVSLSLSPEAKRVADAL